MKDLVESMVEWQQGRCLDPGVWNHIRPRLNPRLMPAPSVVQPRPPAKRRLDDVEYEEHVRFIFFKHPEFTKFILTLKKTFSFYYFNRLHHTSWK